MTFTAKISKNFRDTTTGTPKVLLRSICTDTDEFRDHAWVEINPQLKKIVASIKGNRSMIISLQADEKVYCHRQSKELRRTLSNCRDIQIIGRA